MTTNTDERPDRALDNDKQEDTGNSDKGDHAKVGFPGKLQAARTSAPDSATDDEINRVAWEAYTEGVHPEAVWSDQPAEIAEGGGG